MVRLNARVCSGLSKFFQRVKIRDYTEGEMKIILGLNYLLHVSPNKLYISPESPTQAD
jgi:hypothetical protein